jgi:hypothetical protein
MTACDTASKKDPKDVLRTALRKLDMEQYALTQEEIDWVGRNQGNKVADAVIEMYGFLYRCSADPGGQGLFAGAVDDMRKYRREHTVED